MTLIGRLQYALTVSLLIAVSCSTGFALDIHVSPAGDDSAAGTEAQPVQTLERAQHLARAQAGKVPVRVILHEGTYYLPRTLVFTSEDSGTAQAPVTYTAGQDQEVVLSGGRKLELTWEPYRDGIYKAATPAELEMDQLFVNGVRQRMARYPNYNPDIKVYGGFAADAFSRERAADWDSPQGGYIHAMHRHRWGGYHYRITGKDDEGNVTYEGGWQNNRQMGMHPQHRFVENIFEELDAPGEWFHDTQTATLYYFPTEDVNPATATMEVATLRHLIEFRGTQQAPVRFVNLNGLTFRHAARTFMDTREPLLRSDWTIYRGGAVLYDGAEDCQLTDSTFDQVGGNAIFVNNYNRRITIRGCLITDAGASGVVFVGDPDAVRNPLFEYAQRQSIDDIDLTPGPRTDNYPADCVVEDSLIRRIGRVEKQSAGVQISMAARITMRHCSIYDVPRAGINVSEGTWGGHLIEYCDVFDTVLETHDHGSFNSWGRDRFWGLRGDITPEKLAELALLDAVETTIIRNSRWRCDHGWDIDLDDGSTNYHIYNNLMLRGGLKLREGFQRVAENNIHVHNSLHPHVWYPLSDDVFRRNIVFTPYRPINMPAAPWDAAFDHNLLHAFGQHDAQPATVLQQASGLDEQSVTADAMFVDPTAGDYRVRDDSPALALGFENFSMDQFGVQKPELRAIARTPDLPRIRAHPPEMDDARTVQWRGTQARELTGEAFSAFGVSRDDGGVHLVRVPPDSPAYRAGLRTNDVIQKINGQAVRTVADLRRADEAAGDQPMTIDFVREQQAGQLEMQNR